MRLWLPIGDTLTRIFAVEDEDTFRWGNLNVIDHTIAVPDAPDLVWNLSKIATPEVASYWSDGSANVDLNLTFVNNGTDESQVVVIECSQNEVIVDDCGAEFSVEKESGCLSNRDEPDVEAATWRNEPSRLATERQSRNLHR